MRTLSAALLALLFFLLPACKKSANSDSDLIVNKIKAIIKSENVVRLIPLESRVPGTIITITPEYGKTYHFDAPFLSIGSYSYNLTRLIRYEIEYFESEKTLFLYF